MKIILEGTSEEIKNILGTFGNNNAVNLVVNQTEKVNIPEGYVDLGLPSGTLWATCNLGANKPEEYGLYYQWGDTVGYTGDEAKNHSYWGTAPFNGTFAEYNCDYFALVCDEVCPNGVLLPKYDAVFQATNGVAHMPTKEQFEELIANTKSEWVTVNGVKGRKCTSKTNDSQYIFIPTSGHYNSGKFYAGKFVSLWSSSLSVTKPNIAHDLYLDSYYYTVNATSRYYGFCVRGVIG